MKNGTKKTENSFQPKKSLGQNFLIDKSVIAKICSAADLSSTDEVFEVGPGKGSLTYELLNKVKKVYAVEKDDYLAEELSKEYTGPGKLELINEDVLKLDFKNFRSSSKLKFISNLPYNITSPVIGKLTASRDIFSEIVIMIQKEVGERISSSPGTKSYGSLSVMVQTYFEVQKVLNVPPAAFRPRPRVHSIVIKLLPTGEYISGIKDEKLYEKVVKSSFSSRRKMLLNSLQSVFNKKEIAHCLKAAEINGKRRAETLGLAEFIDLANSFYELQQSTSSIRSSF